MRILSMLLLGTYNLIRLNKSQLRNVCSPDKYIGTQAARRHFRKDNFPMWDIYSPNPLDLTDNGVEFSAEHVYPHSFLSPNKNAQKDIHNLFATRMFINRHRSNYRFSETLTSSGSTKMVDHSSSSERIYFDESLYNYKNAHQRTFVPIHKARGVIARSIAYMGLIYPELDIQDVIDLRLLKEWNLKHPPDNREIVRNKKIQNIQCNQNPFIIVPELVESHF
jgi:endonuclease I